jgi:hypothetical protein
VKSSPSTPPDVGAVSTAESKNVKPSTGMTSPVSSFDWTPSSVASRTTSPAPVVVWPARICTSSRTVKPCRVPLSSAISTWVPASIVWPSSSIIVHVDVPSAYDAAIAGTLWTSAPNLAKICAGTSAAISARGATSR